MTWRMNALSSTTSTVGRLDDTTTCLQGVHLDPSISEVEVDAASVIATHVFGEQCDPGCRQRGPRCGDVSFPDVDATICQQRREHARPTDEPRLDPARRSEPLHLGEQHRYGGRRELCVIRLVA